MEKNLSIELEQGGIINDNGEIERPMPLRSPIFLPKTRLVGKGQGARLAWEWTFGTGSARPLKEKEGVLEAFINLCDAPPLKYVEFANRWGVLDLCQHDRPATHNFPFCPRTQDEPISIWRNFAQSARAILRLAASLHQDKIGDIGDWQTIQRSSDQVGDYVGGDAEIDRFVLAHYVNEILGFGHVQPTLSWSEPGPPTISLDGAGTFGTIATQIAFAVFRHSLAVCRTCGQPYFPERKPARGRRNYCLKCRKDGAAKRDSSRDYWRRTHPNHALENEN